MIVLIYLRINHLKKQPVLMGVRVCAFVYVCVHVSLCMCVAVRVGESAHVNESTSVFVIRRSN